MFLRYVWASPATLLGLVFVATAAGNGRVTIVHGVIEAHGLILRWALRYLTLVCGGVSAMTFGHVVLGRDQEALDHTRAHERVHVRQYERWGPVFIPAYVLASLWAAVRGGHAYFDNPFEREAWRREWLR
jgi:hypothetical protein